MTRLVLSYLVFREFVDDAYIYLRYCDNWNAGLGLVYNAGERVIAFTSYLYVVLIAAIDKLAVGISLTSVVMIFDTLIVRRVLRDHVAIPRPDPIAVLGHRQLPVLLLSVH